MAVILPLLTIATTAVAESGVVAAVGSAMTSAATTAAGFLGVGGAAAPALGAAAPALGAAAPAAVSGAGLTTGVAASTTAIPMGGGLAGTGGIVWAPAAAGTAVPTILPGGASAAGGLGTLGKVGMSVGSQAASESIKSGAEATRATAENVANAQRGTARALADRGAGLGATRPGPRQLAGSKPLLRPARVPKIPMTPEEGADLVAGTGQYADYTPIGQDMGYSFASTGSDPRSVLTGGWASGSDVTGGMSDAEVLSQPFSGAMQTPHGDPAGYEALKQSLGTWDLGDGAPGWEGRVSEPFGMDDLWGAVEGSGKYLWEKGGDLWEGMKEHPGPTIFGLAALDQLLARREADERMKGEKKRKQELAARYPIYGGYRGEGIARQEPYWVSDPSWNRRIG